MALIVKEGTNGWDGTDEATKKIVTDALEKEGFTIRTAQQDKDFVAGQSQSAIDEAFQKRNQQLEDTILQKSGIPKLNINEKYFDYFARVIELKSTEANGLKEKIAKFEKEGVNGNALAEGYKKQVEVLQGEITSLKTEYETKIAEKDGAMFKTKIDSSIDAAINKLKGSFRGDIAEEFINDIVSSRKAQFESQFTAKEIGGIIVLHDKDGKPVMSKKDHKPVSIDEKIAEIFGTYIDEKKAQGGAGSSKPNPQKPGVDGKAPAWKEATLPDNIKSKPALVKWLQSEMKLASGTKDFDDAFAQFSKTSDGKELSAREVAVSA